MTKPWLNLLLAWNYVKFTGTLMAQYRPAWHAFEVAHKDPVYHSLKCPITGEEVCNPVRKRGRAAPGIPHGLEIETFISKNIILWLCRNRTE